MNRIDNASLGILLRIFSGVLFAGMIICVKILSEDVPLGEIVFFRSFFAIIPLIVFLVFRKEFPHGLATKRPVGHFVRASIGAIALFLSFASITLLNLAEAILIAQLSPILMAIIAAAVLSERLTLWRVGGLLLGFGGVIVLVWPEWYLAGEYSSRLVGYIIALIAAICSAVALMMVRSLNRTESPGAIALYFVLASMIGALFTLPWGWGTLDGQTLVLLIASGLFGGFAHIVMTLAFRYAEVSRLAPYEYIALLWPVLADLLIFQIELSRAFMFATPLILLGAILASLERDSSQRLICKINRASKNPQAPD